MLVIEGVIKMLKHDESPGQDNMIVELIKYLGEQLMELIKDLI